MLEIIYWFKGFLIGFIVSTPLGPVELLCIKRVMSRGILQGFATGAGAALGDGFYSLIAAFGLTLIINFLVQEAFWFKLFGGVLIVGVGIYWLIKKNNYKDFNEIPDNAGHIGGAFTTAFLLNLANPITLILYLAIFSGFGLAYASHHLYSAASLVIGVLMGAATWWFLLVELVTIFKKKLTSHALARLNKMISLLVILFGIFILLTALFHIKLFGKTF